MSEKYTAPSQSTESKLGNALLEAHQAEIDHVGTAESIRDAYARFQRGEITGPEYARISSGAEASGLRLNATRKAVNQEIKRENRPRPSVKRRLASFIMHH